MFARYSHLSTAFAHRTLPVLVDLADSRGNTLGNGLAVRGAGGVTMAEARKDLYEAAILETDWSRIEERMKAADSAISRRLEEFSLNHGGTPEENQAIADALNGLTVLRREVAEHAEKQIPQKNTNARQPSASKLRHYLKDYVEEKGAAG